MQLLLIKLCSKSNFLNLLFSLIPLSFVAGNLVLNANIFLFIISAVIFYGKDIFKVKIDYLDKIILLIFIFILYTTIYSTIENYQQFFYKQYLTATFKSLYFLRFLILYFVIRYMVENKIINFKFFFLSCFLFTSLVSLDLFYQSTFGKDIFGYQAYGRKMSGPFGDELIAGGYIQRFSIFSFFLLPLLFKNTKKTKFVLTNVFMLLFFFVAIVISGNRMPLILYVFVISLLILFDKKLKKYFFLILMTVTLAFLITLNFNPKMKQNFLSFKTTVLNLSLAITGNKEKLINNKIPDHYKEFSTFYDTWLMNKYIGGGIKTFRFNCHKAYWIKRDLWLTDGPYKKPIFLCNTHPHNYYLEILSDLGLIGFFILTIIFMIVLFKSVKKRYFMPSTLKYNQIVTPFIFIFLAEIFPIKSSGSFFTTGNATFIFLVLSIIIALTKDKNFKTK